MDTKDIERFDPTREVLQQLVEKTKGITATDLKDKAQLAVVKENRIELKKARVQIEKTGEAMREDANAYAKAVIAKQKELISIISPEEDRLKAIEAEAEELILKEERMAKLPERKERLAQIGDLVEVSDEKLLTMDAVGFEAYYNSRVADKNRADEAAKREEQNAKQKELDDREAKLKEEEQRLEAEKEAREREERAREEEREKARIAEEKRLAEAKRAKEDAEKKEREDKEKLEKAERYREWRKAHGWTPETCLQFKEEKVEETIVLWKKVDTFKLTQEKSPLQFRYDALKWSIEQEETQYSICAENPTDTAQFRNALEQHRRKINGMKAELAELSKEPGIII